jgi:CRP-like cAMP-binding protein
MLDPYPVTIVSCDILGHSAADGALQVIRVAAINRIVANLLDACELGDVVWSSGGDGGHVVFRQEVWQQDAIRLVIDLYTWSETEGVPLRIVCHRGSVAHIRGADGRVQMVGEGINFAGWLLSQVTREGVVVSDSFRREIEDTAVEPAIEFHDQRFIPNVDFKPELLYLMSTGSLRSAWIESADGDRAALDSAVRRDGGWDVIYFAKRVWQANSADRDVDRALESVKAQHLQYYDAKRQKDEINDLFGHLEPDELNEVLRLGQLVERRRGDLICRYNEPGDTLFVILLGQVGVFRSEGGVFEAQPKHRHRRGEIVGELAYALGRDRTADLVALTDVALLSINNADLQSRLSGTQVGEAAARRVSAFINERILEHVADNVPYLLGPSGTGPLAVQEGAKDEYPLTILRRSCHLITLPRHKMALKLDDLSVPGSAHRGLCILTEGEVRSGEPDSVVLDGKDFPLLWADVPNLLPLQERTYSVGMHPIKVLCIDADGIDKFGARQREALRKALPRAVNHRPDQFEYDVYLCHAKRDWPIVEQIRARLIEANITCWVDNERILPGASVTESIEHGLSSSRFLLACLSENFAKSKWAQREMRVALHLDVKRREGDHSVLPLMLQDDVDKDDVISPLLRDSRRVSYDRGDEFEKLVEFIVSRSR